MKAKDIDEYATRGNNGLILLLRKIDKSVTKSRYNITIANKC